MSLLMASKFYTDTFKGSLSLDFRLLGFFHDLVSTGLCISHWRHLECLWKFAKIFTTCVNWRRPRPWQIIADVVVNADKLLPFCWRRWSSFVPDFHRFHDTSDKYIAVNNDTGDNVFPVTTTPAIIFEKNLKCQTLFNVLCYKHCHYKPSLI